MAADSCIAFILYATLTVASSRLILDNLSDRVVTTQAGDLRGILIPFSNRNLQSVEAYLGLEYASLHGGDLRFMPPSSPLNKWDGVKIANSFGPACPQKRYNFDSLEEFIPSSVADRWREISKFIQVQAEDCLFLNIYIPARDRSGPAPVIVLIHGESYEFGTGNAYDGSVLAAQADIAVITLNYRLGALGFLSTGDRSASGNYALFDLVAAMHWIQTNVADFGGDPKKVTVLGHGYGAALANLLSLAPISKSMNLFDRLILHSGSALSTWSMAANPGKTASDVGRALKCMPTTSQPDEPIETQDLVKCLRLLPAEELMNVNISRLQYTAALGPVVDRMLILDTPDILMSSPDTLFADIEVIFGTNNMDGGLFLSGYDIIDGITTHRKNRLMKSFVRSTYSYHRQEIYDILSHHYASWADKTLMSEKQSNIDQVCQLLGDGLFVSPAVVAARLHLRHGKDTYFFLFNHSPGSAVNSPVQDGYFGDSLAFLLGAALTNEISPYEEIRFTNTERYLAGAVMTFWGNFVKSGSPNIPLQPQSSSGDNSVQKIRFSDVYWPQYEPVTEKMLVLEPGSGMRPLVQHNYRSDKIALWTDLIPKLYQKDSEDTHKHEADEFGPEENSQRDFEVRHILPPPPTPPPPHKSASNENEEIEEDKGNIDLSIDGGKPVDVTRIVTRIVPKEVIVTVTARSGEASEHSKEEVEMTLSLSLTIGVGCALLFLNLLIFVGVCVQKKRLRRERRKIEKLKEAGIPLEPCAKPAQPTDCHQAPQEQIALLEQNLLEKCGDGIKAKFDNEGNGSIRSSEDNRFQRAPNNSEYAVPRRNGEIRTPRDQCPRHPHPQNVLYHEISQQDIRDPQSPVPRVRESLSRTSSYHSQASLCDSAYPGSARTPRQPNSGRMYRNYSEEIARQSPARIFNQTSLERHREREHTGGHFGPKHGGPASSQRFDEGGSSDSGVRA